MTLSENIREIRRSRGLTQERLAEAVGVSTASVSKWENGQSVPEVGMLTALADYFEISVDALVGHEVRVDRKQAMLAEMEDMSREKRFGEAMELAGKLLRSYPNDCRVVDKAAELYYHIFVVVSDRAAMEYSIELVRRLFMLEPDPSGTKRFELLRRLGNQYELLGDWAMARKYYEEGNVNGRNDRDLAHIRGREKEDAGAAEAISQVFIRGLVDMLGDVLRLKDIYKSMGKPEMAAAALRWGLTALEGAGLEAARSYAVLGVAMAVELATLEKELGNTDGAEKAVRRAVWIVRGSGGEGTEGFLSGKLPEVVVSENADSPQALEMLLRTVAMDEFGDILREELE